MLVDERCAEGEIRIAFAHALEPLLHIQLHVATGYPRVIEPLERATVVPIAALLAGKHLDRCPVERLVDKAAAEQRVVYAKAALLICAEDEARTELLVEVSCGKLKVLVLALDINIRNAPALVIGLKAWQRMVKVFNSCTGVNVLARQIDLAKGVSKGELTVILGANLCISLGYQYVALDATRYLHFACTTVFLRKCRHSGAGKASAKGYESKESQGCSFYLYDYFTSSRTFSISSFSAPSVYPLCL